MADEYKKITDSQTEKRDKLLKVLDDIKGRGLTGKLSINFDKGNLSNSYKYEISENLDK